jgi:hypothetical protein
MFPKPELPDTLSKTCRFGWAFFTGCWCQWAQQSVTPAIDWLDSLIGPGDLVLVVSHLCQVPVFSFMRGVGEKKTKLGCEKYFCKVTYWAWLEMLLRSIELSRKHWWIDHGTTKFNNACSRTAILFLSNSSFYCSPPCKILNVSVLLKPLYLSTT